MKPVGRGQGLRSRVHTHPRYRWIVLLTVGGGMMMAILSSSIINIALPFITSDFGSEPGTMAWVLTVFMITQATLMPVAGRAGDLYGHKRVFISGLIWFAATSLLCAAAWNPLSLIVSRALQAVAASALAPMALAFIYSSFPAGERPQALGVMGGVMGSAPVLGFTLGGVLVQGLGWRWVFLFNLPLSAILIPAAAFILRESDDRRQGEKFDIPGALLLTTGLMGGLLGLTQGSDWGWSDPRVLAGFAWLAAALVLFIYWESKASQPMMDLGLLRLRSLVSANVAGFFSTGAMFGAMFLLPFFFLLVLGDEAAATGLVLAPLALMYVLAAPIGGRLTGRFGFRATALAGLVLAAAGYVLVSRSLVVGASGATIGLAIAVMGAGLGLSNAPLTSAALHEVPADKRGIASSLPSMFRFVGGSFAIALIGGFFSWRVTGHLLGAGVPQEQTAAGLAGAGIDLSPVFKEAYAASFREVFLFALIFVAAAIAAVLFIPRLRDGSGS